MKRIFLLMIALLFLAGCWDQRELMERGFILGAAIDEDQEKVELTVQFYRPVMIGSSEGGGGGGREPIVTTIESESVSEAARNLVNYFGRKANWSHMQVIVVGEETVRHRHFNDILAFFYREQEPRATTNLMIGKGKGSDYLATEPMFEYASSRQFRELQRISHDEAGNTLDTTLHELSLQLQSELGVAIVPLVEKKIEKEITTSPLTGVAIIKDGVMVGDLDGTETQHVLIIRQQYNRGIWKIPCEEDPSVSKSDNMEIIVRESRVSPDLVGEQIIVDVDIEFEVRVRELMCDTVLETSEEVNAYAQKIEETIEEDLNKTIEGVKKKKVDVLNLGNDYHKKDAKKWEEIKDDWEEYFESAQFVYDINVEIVSSGLVDLKPFVEMD
ncbi:Ger(x)C family spore germination protein [Halalkalibacter sp. AB-rgal2]|uniref:Ger(x)C family spore germination protein n=1 Tax=Halalkalibacter sp. AB-rgal2 TaxID=3242695 RepID=UPI00359E4227